jgi:hypothetical protein
MKCSKENLKLYKKYGQTFLKNIITEDKTLLILYLPELKQPPLELHKPGDVIFSLMRTGL